MLSFQHPFWLIFIPVLIPLLTWHYIRRLRMATPPLRYSHVSRLKNIPRGFLATFRHLLFVLRLIAMTLILIALARPQSALELEPVYTEGVDIIIVLDVSNSMRAIDLDMKEEKDRLQVAKEIVHKFIDGRRNDRIGLVVFGAFAATQCPMTVDYPILHQFLENTEIGVVDERATAIGNALASAVSRLRNSQAKSKVVILLTDGENNAGEIDPLTAAEIARTFGIRVYTVGVGAYGTALFPVSTVFGQRYQRMQVKIDEDMLQEMSRITDAKYFRATDRRSLESIFTEIDELEKTKIESPGVRRYRELFRLAGFPALGFLILELILAHTLFKTIP